MRPSSECFYVGGRSVGAGTTQENECGELFVTRIHHIFDVVPSPLTREAPGGDGGLLQRPPPALLTTDTFIPAQNTTTCTMRPLGKAAAASGKAADGTRPGVHCGVWEGRRRRSSRARHAACESSRRPPARSATWRQRLHRVQRKRPPYSARKVGCSWLSGDAGGTSVATIWHQVVGASRHT